MDRFIVVESIDDEYHYANLKSNMDRFIARKSGAYKLFYSTFKIQYG